MRKRIFTFWLLLCSVMLIQAQNVRYVTEKGSGDGTSWTDASGDLQAMIDELAELGGGQIRLAGGVYVPARKVAEADVAGNPTIERDKAFVLKSNIELYGGYKGDDSNTRDTETYTSVLSGAINKTDTAFHVLVAVKAENVVLNGLTITNGRAYYSSDKLTTSEIPAGDPLLNAVWLEDETEKETYYSFGRMGGAALLGRFSSISMEKVYITKNGSGQYGGSLNLNVCKLEITNSFFIENFSDAASPDAGIFSNRTDLTLSTLTFSENRGNLIRTPNNSSNHPFTDKIGEISIQNITVENSAGNGGFNISENLKKLDNIFIKNSTFYFSISGVKKAFTSNNISIVNCINPAENNTASIIGITNCNTDYFTFENLLIENCTSTFTTVSAISKIEYKNSKFINNTTIPTTVQPKGGIFYTYGSGSSTLLNNCEVLSNTSNSLNYSWTNVSGYKPTFTAVNSVFADNTVTGEGFVSPALFQTLIERQNAQIFTLPTIILNSTIVNNLIEGTSTSYIIDCSEEANAKNTTIYNSIIWGNHNESGNPATLDYLSEITGISNSLIEGMTLAGYTACLDGTTADISKVFINPAAHGIYNLRHTGGDPNPVINAGNKTFLNNDGADMTDLRGEVRVTGTNVDMGAYEYQEADPTPVFDGGIIETGQRRFVYNGNPINLKLSNLPEGITVSSYSWTDDDGNSGSGLPVNAGIYQVTATTSNSQVFTIQAEVDKRYLSIQLSGVEMTERAYGVTPDVMTLKASYDNTVYTGSASFKYTYTSSQSEVAEVTKVDEQESLLVAGKSGHSVIRTQTSVTGDANFLRNYEIGEAMAVATVLPLVIDGTDTQVTIEEETEGEGITFDEEVTIRGDVTFEDDVIFEEEVTIEGEPTNFNGGATFEGEAEIDGEVRFNTPDDKEVVFEDKVTINDKVTFEGDVTFKDEVTFNGETEFNGNVTFENGANFTNETPVFNGDVTLTGDITLPTGETLTIDNSGTENTIRIEGEAIFSEGLTITGGELTLGKLTVEGTLTLTDVTINVGDDASIQADVFDATGGNTINLESLDNSVNPNTPLTIVFDGSDPNKPTLAADLEAMFEITIAGKDAASDFPGVVMEWVEDPTDTWTLQVVSDALVIGGDPVYDEDMVFEENVIFTGTPTFNGDVTFEEGADFINETPVFNGDVTISGEINLPAPDGSLTIGDGQTLTVDSEAGEVIVTGDVTIDGGKLVLGKLEVSGELTLNGATLVVSPGATIDAGSISGTPKSVIDLSQMPIGENGVTIGELDGITPDDLFTISAGGAGYRWTDNADGTYTLTVTRSEPDPDDTVYITLTIPDTLPEGVTMTPGPGTRQVALGGSLRLTLTVDEMYDGSDIFLKLNDNYVLVREPGGELSFSYTLTDIREAMTLEVVITEGFDPNPEPGDPTTGNATLTPGVRVTGESGKLKVESDRATKVLVYAINGKLVANRAVNGTEEFYLPAGIYIVQTGTTPVKVVVR